MPQPNDDLFQDSRMTFGEHLEELRNTLVKAMISLAIGIAASLYFTPSVVQFLQTPVERAIKQFRVNKARAELQRQYGFVPDEQAFLLSEYNLIPKEVRVHPADLLRLLQAYRPEDFPKPINDLEFSGLNIPVELLQPLAARLVNPEATVTDEATRAGITAIVARLTDEERAFLSQLREMEASQVGTTQQVPMLQLLNRLLPLETLYQDAAFKSIFEEAEASWLTQFWNAFWQIDEETGNALKQIREAYEKEGEPRLLQRLNRTLIERLALPEQAPNGYQTLTFWEPAQASTVALGAGEGFMIYLKASLLTGTIVAGPFIFYFLWTFVAAGLYPQEQRYVYLYLPFSLALFAAGVLVAFIFAFEPVLKFLFSFNMLLGIDPQPRIGEWLSFVMLLPLGFGVAFQLPLVMLLLFRIGIISLETYVSQWRMAILIIAVISMLATPADPISMLLLGGPLILLYVFGIFLCRLMPANRRAFPEGYDPA